jgi:hypothetical protein
MRVSKPLRIGGWILLSLSVVWIWYIVAANYGYGAVSGTYVLRCREGTAALVLRPDRSFQEDLNCGGKSERALGRWHRFGEAGIVFSREFLKLPGQKISSDGEAYGRVEKTFFGLLPVIKLDPIPGGPNLKRRLFR